MTKPSALTAAQLERCQQVERAYREQLAEYPALRDEAASDPATVGWLVRMFVLDLFTVREGRPLDEDQDLLRAAARIVDPKEAGALAEIVTLGARAVPTLVGDLLLHGQPQPRELGIELLGRVGTVALPAVQEVARSDTPHHRRAAARALGAIGQDAGVFAALRQLASDEVFSVRADALRSLRSGGVESETLLIARLRDDTDGFVRRVAAQTLPTFHSEAAAMALVDYLERSKRERDLHSERAAQLSLQQMAGTRGPRTAEAWRMFARTLVGSVDASR